MAGGAEMQSDSMRLQQDRNAELLASERALSSCRSEIYHERQWAQKHAMALQRGEFEVQRARQHSELLEASFYGSSIQSDPGASPQSPSLTATDLTLACADVSPLARVSQISQESVLDQSQATLSHGHLSDEVDVDVPPGEIPQRGSGSSCLMDAESLTGEACNLSPHAGTEMVEDGGLIRRSVVDEKDAMVLDFDVEAPADPQDDGHLSMSTTFEAAPDADASTKDASPARSDALEGEVHCIRRPTQQARSPSREGGAERSATSLEAVPTSRDAQVQTEPEAQPEKAVKALVRTTASGELLFDALCRPHLLRRYPHEACAALTSEKSHWAAERLRRPGAVGQRLAGMKKQLRRCEAR
eukprot:s610_g3.t1